MEVYILRNTKYSLFYLYFLLISWPGNSIKINNIERLKFKDPLKPDILSDSTTIKVVFEAKLLPKYIYIWKIRRPVSPFINRVGRCLTVRWDHSISICKSKSICARCSENRELYPQFSKSCITKSAIIGDRGNPYVYL